MENGERLTQSIWELIPPDEAEILIYYGRIGSGKTSAGTRNIMRDLMSGQIVYANWKIQWEGYDERKSKWKLFLGTLGLKKNYLVIPKENFHFWNFTTQEIDGIKCFPFVDQLALLNDCKIHLDEGHIPFDSYEATRMDEKKRSAIFATRHFNRSLSIYTQRANSVHVNLRGNTNRFYKCEKLFDRTFFGKRFIHFLITEFQDLTSSNTVDESRERDPETGEENGPYKFAVSQQTYWGRKKHFALFDSKYLRQGAPSYQQNYAQVWWLRWKERFANLKMKIKK